MSKTKRAKSKKARQKQDLNDDGSSTATNDLESTHNDSHTNVTGYDALTRRSPRLQSTPKKIAKSPRTSTESSTANIKDQKGTKRKREVSSASTGNKTPPNKRQKTNNEEVVVRIELLDEPSPQPQRGKKNSAHGTSPKNTKQQTSNHNGSGIQHGVNQSNDKVTVNKSKNTATVRQSPIKQRKPNSSVSIGRKAAPKKRAKSKAVRKRPGKPKRVLPKLSIKKSAPVIEEESAMESDQIDNREHSSDSESSSSKSSSSKSSSKSSRSSKSSSSKSNSSHKSSSKSDKSESSRSARSDKSGGKSPRDKSDKSSSAQSSPVKSSRSNSSASESEDKSDESSKSHSSKKSKSRSEQESEASDSSSDKSGVTPIKTQKLSVKSKSNAKAVSNNATKTMKSASTKKSVPANKATATNRKARSHATKKKKAESEKDDENTRLESLDAEVSRFMPLLVSIMTGKKQTPRAKQWNLGLKARSQMHYKVHMGGFASGEVDDILSIVQRKIMKMQVPENVQRGGVSHFILDVLWPELAVLLLAARKSVSKKEAEQLFTADNDLEDEWIKTLKQSPERKAPTIVILD